MHTNTDFISTGRIFPPLSDESRLRKYSHNQKMFDGDHADVFSLHKELIRNIRGDKKTHELLLNWFERMTTLWADLLLGETPVVTEASGNEEITQEINALLAETQFWRKAYQAAMDASTFGDAVIKVRRDDKGKVKVSLFKPCFWFPVVSESDAEEITAHVLAWKSANCDDPDPEEQQRPKYLYVEIHTADNIEYRTYLLQSAGKVVNSAISKLAGDIVTEANPIGENLVTHIANLQRSGCIFGIDDYGKIASIVDELEVRFAQNSFVLDKHGNPKMYGPQLEYDTDEENGAMQVKSGDYIQLPPETSVFPTYITWDGHLDASFKQIEQLMRQLYTLSETTQSLFDDSKTGANESGTAIRKHLMLPLAKVNRTRINFDAGLKEVIHKLYKLETGKDIQVNIQWMDGLPDDETEELTNAVKAVDTGLVSKNTARKKLYNMSEEEATAEAKQIAEEENFVEPPTIKTEPMNGEE